MRYDRARHSDNRHTIQVFAALRRRRAPTHELARRALPGTDIARHRWLCNHANAVDSRHYVRLAQPLATGDIRRSV
jgi:hypothetical protein